MTRALSRRNVKIDIDNAVSEMTALTHAMTNVTVCAVSMRVRKLIRLTSMLAACPIYPASKANPATRRGSYADPLGYPTHGVDPSGGQTLYRLLRHVATVRPWPISFKPTPELP